MVELWKRRSVLANFSDRMLEGKLVDQKLCRFLVVTDLSHRHGTGEAVISLLLHAIGGRGTLTSSLGNKLLPGGLGPQVDLWAVCRLKTEGGTPATSNGTQRLVLLVR